VQPEVQSNGNHVRRGPVPRRTRLRRERRRRRILVAKLAAAFLALMMSAALVVSVVTMHLGVKAVLTGSMRPDYGPGALLLTKRIPTDIIHPGMIVLFVPPGETSEYAHRVMTVSGPENAPVITTKGDANKAADPWHAKIVSPTISEVIGSVPGIGRLLVAVRGTGQILLAVLGGLVAAWACARWAFSPQRPPGRRTTAGTA
jgi:signal peptidase